MERGRTAPGYRRWVMGVAAGCAIFALGVALADAPADGAASGPADDVEAVIREADALQARREHAPTGPVMNRQVELLEAAVARHPENFELLWRLSRAYFWKSDFAPNDRLRSELGEKGMTYGDRARALRPNDVRGHYFAALGVGSYSQGMGIITALRRGMERRFNERLDRAIAVDARFDCGGPLVTKGRYFFELPWPKYDAARSVEFLERTLEVCPNSPRAWAYLAEVHLKEGRTAEARAAVDRALAIDPSTFFDPPEARRGRVLAEQVQRQLP
jgi:tetratricopeptide (TPR) repeat protein